MSWPKIADLVEPITELARPFSIYLGALGVFIGLFIPSVSEEKLWVAAAMAGAVSIARSIDKRVGQTDNGPKPGD